MLLSIIDKVIKYIKKLFDCDWHVISFLYPQICHLQGYCLWFFIPDLLNRIDSLSVENRDEMCPTYYVEAGIWLVGLQGFVWFHRISRLILMQVTFFNFSSVYLCKMSLPRHMQWHLQLQANPLLSHHPFLTSSFCLPCLALFEGPWLYNFSGLMFFSPNGDSHVLSDSRFFAWRSRSWFADACRYILFAWKPC